MRSTYLYYVFTRPALGCQQGIGRLAARRFGFGAVDPIPRRDLRIRSSFHDEGRQASLDAVRGVEPLVVIAGRHEAVIASSLYTLRGRPCSGSSGRSRRTGISGEKRERVLHRSAKNTDQQTSKSVRHGTKLSWSRGAGPAVRCCSVRTSVPLSRLAHALLLVARP
jgi:hypothetical protein